MSDLHGLGDPAGNPGTADDPAPSPPDNWLVNDFLHVRALAQHINVMAQLDAHAAAYGVATASPSDAAPPTPAPNPAASGGAPPQAASPGAMPRDPEFAATDTPPRGLGPQLGQLASNAWDLTKQAFAPEVGAYENFIVRPLQTTLSAAAQTPLGDPGFYASMDGSPGLGLIAGAGTEAASGLRWLTRVGPDTRALAARAQEVHDILADDPIALRSRTAANLQTDGGKIIAAGGRDLSPAQRDALGSGEISAKLPGAHAEVTALEGAKVAGFKPEALAATRKICPQCEAAIEAAGGWLTSPTTAVFGP